MFKKNDPYSYRKFINLELAGVQIGTVQLDFIVKKHDDVQLNNNQVSTELATRKFHLQCTQRVIIYNENGLVITPEKNSNEFDDYPVLLNIQMNIDQGGALKVDLLGYSPQTVNTKVQTSGTTGDETGKVHGSSSNTSIGSNTSQTNSYGASVTESMTDMGDLVSESVSATEHYDHSRTSGHSNSYSSGNSSSTSSSNNASSSKSMSVKDWGAYGFVNPATNCPVWNFGQEFPWDAIMCRKEKKNGINSNGKIELEIPAKMSLQLYDGTLLNPPSHLSSFGLNFVTQALWLLTLDNDAALNPIKFKTFINYSSASHKLGEDGKVSVLIDEKQSQLISSQDNAVNLNPSFMGLDPLGVNRQPAIIGFLKNKFLKSPAQSGANPPQSFAIISSTNNLIVKDNTAYPKNCKPGYGFELLGNILSAGFSERDPKTGKSGKLSVIMYFKVVDLIKDYSLYIKHWKTKSNSIKLTFTINGDKSNLIEKYVNNLESEGGENNLLSIVLRNLDYSSVNYHDYLHLGLNSIEIAIEPYGTAPAEDYGYQIRAISIE